jgi:hypothetical protein
MSMWWASGTRLGSAVLLAGALLMMTDKADVKRIASTFSDVAGRLTRSLFDTEDD